MMLPARSRYGATRPAVLDWFKLYNRGRSYPEQVKPFNFMLSFFARRQEDLKMDNQTLEWDSALDEVRPVAPYSNNVVEALDTVFDRGSDRLERVTVERLRTVADVLRDYHRQPEYKFLGGGWNERGILRRRHVFAEKIDDIGKETDGWEEDDARSEDQDTVLVYPSSSMDRERMIETIKSVGKRELMREARIAMRTINAGRSGANIANEDLNRMADAAARIMNRQRAGEAAMTIAISRLYAERDEIGLAELAKILSVDRANLEKIIKGKRTPSKALLKRIGTLHERRD
jgi:hypothetical protein